MSLLVNFVNLLTQALVIAIVLRAILSWFVPRGRSSGRAYSPRRDGPDHRALKEESSRQSVCSTCRPFVAIILLQVVRSIVIATLSGAGG